MQASADLVSYIKKHEGFMPHAYLDPPGNTKGKHSIGYGHQIQANEQNLLSQTLTEPEGSAMLDRDIGYYVGSVNEKLKRQVTQPQFDALVDFAYNVGTGAEAKIADTWNTSGDTSKVAAHLQLYNKSGGKVNPDLVARRNYEAGLFQGLGHEIASVTAGLTEVVEKKKPGSLS